MSIHDNNFFSNTLGRLVFVRVILPEPLDEHGQVEPAYARGSQKLPTLWLLHGLGGDATTWTRESAIERLATTYRVAVVMPQTGRGFYTDMVAGPKYWTFMTEELPQRMRYLFPLDPDPHKNVVAGNSMGGYAALRWALSYPASFAAVAAMSPVTNLQRFRTDQAAIMPDMDNVFDPQQLVDTPVDIGYLAQQPSVGMANLRILMTTGSADMLREQDVASKQQFEMRFGDRFTWAEFPGKHAWPLWNQQLPAVMHWLWRGTLKPE